MAIRFFRTATQPCIKWRGVQACNLINALKTVKMDSERAKSQMAPLCVPARHFDSLLISVLGRVRAQAWLTYRQWDRYRAAAATIYSEIDLLFRLLPSHGGSDAVLSAGRQRFHPKTSPPI